MKISMILAGACAAVALSSAAFAQTTYQFGEGQAGMSKSQPEMQNDGGAAPTQHAMPQRKAKMHHKHHGRHVKTPDTYKHQ
ncbi:hypothetical protein DIE23_31935 [Burkholderia sp. Bp9143]|uniref:hypothetical protein n=1 Tax=Burkholderia sp. Bp9143 TaxID=2184574 RepID=UPI000F5A5AEB|nr:hypothetical protein [Burkholderia sp. Bp9143]RQR25730.1 hypothetical protein DIE23_31935 [Burkholderia sp. Bp9143]